jgi:hypothetical protein
MFAARWVAVPAGDERPYVAAEWRDAIVLLERGAIELVGVSGERRAFAAGALLWLDDVPLRALSNPGEEPAVLLAIARANRLPV